MKKVHVDIYYLVKVAYQVIWENRHFHKSIGTIN